MRHKIYALTEPGEEKAIRYIGYTVTSLTSRLNNHCGRNHRQAHTPKSQWVYSLVEGGQKPNIILLCRGDNGGLMKFVEAVYTHYYSMRGYDLLNGMDCWGFEKGAAAAQFAKDSVEAGGISDEQLGIITDYYFRNLAPESERILYLRTVDNS